ncbi:hypothetical protein GCM10023210_25950 [Chryseobacterium ginsengisoli]|uniref:Bacteriocin n=1 Tax=Chryseobacterium ginsengisoli TaxID=363853 RepID=A0ABP9MD15_9FLAO
MKNLRKLTRNDLKSLQGGKGCGGQYFPPDPPAPGEPYFCDCNLKWCPKYGICVQPTFTKDCEIDF